MWPFRRHSVTAGYAASRCAGSDPYLPVPNLWTALTRLHLLKETTPVEIHLVRDALVAHVAPGDTICHPQTGEPFRLEKLEQLLDQKVTLYGRFPSRPSRRHKVAAEQRDSVKLLPTDAQAEAVWASIAEAVGKAVRFWHGDAAPQPDDARETAVKMAAPWSVDPNGAGLPGLEIRAAGHTWHASVLPTPKPQPEAEPASVEG